MFTWFIWKDFSDLRMGQILKESNFIEKDAGHQYEEAVSFK